MEEFKDLNEILEIDKKHDLLGQLTGFKINLNHLHEELSSIELNREIPEELVGQFNVARNMALYTYFFYALAPEVQLKTYTVIEHALRLKAKPKKRMMLQQLLTLAVKEQWITDKGFHHIKSPSPENEYCKSLIKIIPSLRNSKAHGSTMLVPDCVHHIKSCADFLNQLFTANQRVTSKSM